MPFDSTVDGSSHHIACKWEWAMISQIGCVLFLVERTIFLPYRVGASVITVLEQLGKRHGKFWSAGLQYHSSNVVLSYSSCSSRCAQLSLDIMWSQSNCLKIGSSGVRDLRRNWDGQFAVYLYGHVWEYFSPVNSMLGPTVIEDRDLLGAPSSH